MPAPRPSKRAGIDVKRRVEWKKHNNQIQNGGVAREGERRDEVSSSPLLSGHIRNNVKQSGGPRKNSGRGVASFLCRPDVRAETRERGTTMLTTLKRSIAADGEVVSSSSLLFSPTLAGNHPLILDGEGEGEQCTNVGGGGTQQSIISRINKIKVN